MDYLDLDRHVVHSTVVCPCCHEELKVGFPRGSRFPWPNCPVCGIPLVWKAQEVKTRMFDFTVEIDTERTIIGRT